MKRQSHTNWFISCWTPYVRNLFYVSTVIGLSGCATVVRPNFGPDPAVARAYDVNPSLTNAIAIGSSMREIYTAKVEDQIAWERGTGLGLIGASAIAADLAMRSIGSSEVIGLGLAGAAVYTSGNWLFSKPQQMIYAAGANAVQCALDAIQPLQGPYLDLSELKSKTDAIVSKVEEINRLIRAGAPTTKSEALARASVDRANALLPSAREASGVLSGAGGGLRSSLNAIQLQVMNAYIANSPNLQGLVESLGRALPAMGSKIVGQTLPAISQPGANLINTSAPELERKTGELDLLVMRVTQIVTSVNVRVSDDKLKLCNVDLRQAGLAMKLVPTGELSVPAGGASSVVVSGGVLPYRADWIGLRPPIDQVGLKIESGQGFITVEAKSGSTPNSYQLLVLDAGQGREVVNVLINKTGVDKVAIRQEVATDTAVTSAAQAVDPKVQKIQQTLIDQGIKVKINGKERTLTADGRIGEITIEAMRVFYKRQGVNISDDQVPKGDALLKEVAALLNIS